MEERKRGTFVPNLCFFFSYSFKLVLFPPFTITAYITCIPMHFFPLTFFAYNKLVVALNMADGVGFFFNSLSWGPSKGMGDVFIHKNEKKGTRNSIVS
jgi:hypothetical protein